jgi:hypothetical protein
MKNRELIHADQQNRRLLRTPNRRTYLSADCPITELLFEVNRFETRKPLITRENGKAQGNLRSGAGIDIAVGVTCSKIPARKEAGYSERNRSGTGEIGCSDDGQGFNVFGVFLGLLGFLPFETGKTRWEGQGRRQIIQAILCEEIPGKSGILSGRNGGVLAVPGVTGRFLLTARCTWRRNG